MRASAVLFLLLLTACSSWGNTLDETLQLHVPENSGAAALSDSSAQNPESAVGQAAESGKKTIIGIVRAKWLLNVRAGPWGKIIDGYKPGRKVEIVAREGDWYKIRRGNGYAYVHVSLIEIEGSTSPIADSTDKEESSGPTEVTPGGGSKIFQIISNLVKKFCDANKAYVLGAAHRKSDGIVTKSDCSGFTGQFINKLSALAGVPPVIGKSYPSSTNYASTKYTKQVTSKVPPTNPKDLVQPGDIFVMSKSSPNGHGHVGVFMGYDSAGRALIAHSTTRVSKKGTTVYGNIGTTGVRIEPIPSWYKKRWMGVYRLNNMNEIVDNLQKS